MLYILRRVPVSLGQAPQPGALRVPIPSPFPLVTFGCGKDGAVSHWKFLRNCNCELLTSPSLLVCPRLLVGAVDAQSKATSCPRPFCSTSLGIISQPLGDTLEALWISVEVSWARATVLAPPLTSCVTYALSPNLSGSQKQGCGHEMIKMKECL